MSIPNDGLRSGIASHINPMTPFSSEAAPPKLPQTELPPGDQLQSLRLVEGISFKLPQSPGLRTRQVSLKRSAASSLSSDSSEAAAATAVGRKPRPGSNVDLSTPVTQLFPCLLWADKGTEAQGVQWSV